MDQSVKVIEEEEEEACVPDLGLPWNVTLVGGVHNHTQSPITHHPKRFAYWSGLGNLQILVLETRISNGLCHVCMRGVTEFCISPETTSVF
jgi:hypothetical protein